MSEARSAPRLSDFTNQHRVNVAPAHLTPYRRQYWRGSTLPSERSPLNARAMTPEQRLVRPKIKPFRLLVSWLVAAAALTLSDEPIVGVAAVHGLLRGWRQELQGAA